MTPEQLLIKIKALDLLIDEVLIANGRKAILPNLD